MLTRRRSFLLGTWLSHGLRVAFALLPLVAWLGGGSTAAAKSSAPRAQTAAPVSDTPLTVTPSGSIALGFAVQDPGKLSSLGPARSDFGRSPAIIEWFQAWSEPLYYSSQEAAVKAVGAVPLITWDPVVSTGGVPLAQIADGKYDGYINQAAAAAKAWHGPIFIRFAHEMNLAGSPFGPGVNGNTPATFIAAWQHVVSLFRQDGATNVSWVWSPNVYCGGSCPFDAFYPGDAYVDWVALDGYNYSTVDHVPWMTFSQIFAGSYAAITALTDKPLMIAETASAETGGDKAAWITQTFAALPTSMPRIRAVVWFDIYKETAWQLSSSSGSLAAFRQVEASTTFQGKVTSGGS